MTRALARSSATCCSDSADGSNGSGEWRSWNGRSWSSNRRALLPEGKGDDVVPASEHSPTTRGDRHELPPGRQPIAHRCRLAADRKVTAPELTTGFDVEGMKRAIEGCPDENNPALSDNRASQIRGAQTGWGMFCRCAVHQSHGRAQGNLPELLAGLEVDCHQRAERWRSAGRSPGAQQNPSPHYIRGAFHLVVLVLPAQPPVLGQRSALVEILSGNQLDHRHNPVDRYDRDLSHWIDRYPAPVGAPDVGWH